MSPQSRTPNPLTNALNLLSVAGLTAALTLSATQQPLREANAARPEARVDHLSIPAPAARGNSGQAELGRRVTEPFSMLGITWRSGSEASSHLRIQVRILQRGTWSRWRTLEAHDDATESTGSVRAGTDPLWVGRARGVAARVASDSGALPSGLRLELVDPGADPVLAHTADGSPAYTAQPAITSRSTWGATPASSCDQPRVAEQTKGVIFHHTAGSNSYSRAQSDNIVRGIQAYHMNGQGWCDIGYNFLVDKYGQIFEGRAGGVLNPVRGAHAGNFEVNTYAMGVSMMGNLQKVRPSSAMKTATVKLIGWRIGTNYLSAKAAWYVDGKSLQRISGHRQVYAAGIRPATSTACPGVYGYRWMRTRLRDRVAAYVAHYSTPIKTRATQLGNSVTGVVRVGEYVTGAGRKTRFTAGDLLWRPGSGAYWVSDPIRTAYDGQGAESGTLGFPLADATTDATGKITQRFERGTLTYDPATGQTTLG